MNILRAGIALLFLGAGCLQAAEPRLKFQKEISVAGKSEETLVAFTLDADVFAATQLGLNDLRLKDPHGAAVPFIVRKSQSVKSRTVRRNTWTPKNPSLRPLDNGGLEVTVVLDKDDPSPTGLNVITPLHNFEQRVRVLSSPDGETWQSADDEAVIFDYARYMDVRSESVPFPTTEQKHFQIVIDDVTAEQQSELLELTRRLQGDKETERTERITVDRRPFRIDRIEFWRDLSVEQGDQDFKRDYPIVGFKATEDAKSHQTVIVIDTHREPLTSLTLQTPSRNFSRNCVLEVPELNGVQTSWKQISSATLSRLDFKSVKREQLKVSFPESRQSQYRLTIENRESPPLEVAGIKAEGNVYEVVYLSSANAPYRLQYGDPEAAAPNYDTATIQSVLTERFRPESLTLGAEQPLTPAPAEWNVARALNDPRLLFGVIGVLVIVLGWGLYSAVKRMDADKPPT